MRATRKTEKRIELREKLFKLFNAESINELDEKELNSYFRIYDKACEKLKLNYF